MNRIDRLSAILIQLQSRRVVKAQDIADRFNISLRTVYRDVKALEEAGVPLIGEAGQGYSLVDSYRLPPVMFTREEATAFVTAEKLVEQLTDSINGASFKSAMYKVKAVLKTAEKDYLEAMDNRIEVLKAKRPPHLQSDLNPLQTILTAIAERKVISLNYFSFYRQEHTARCVEPVGVFYLDNYWHLIAYCTSRNDYRNFRFDRMTEVELTGKKFDTQHPTLKDYLGQVYREKNLEQIIIRTNQKTALCLGEQKYYHGYISEAPAADGQVEITFMASSVEWFARWMVSFADMVCVVEPETLHHRVVEILKASIKKFNGEVAADIGLS